jgi:hypothetical protein
MTFFNKICQEQTLESSSDHPTFWSAGFNGAFEEGRRARW